MTKEILNRFHFMTREENLKQLDLLTEKEINNLSEEDFTAVCIILGTWQYGCSKVIVHCHIKHIGRTYKNGKRHTFK